MNLVNASQICFHSGHFNTLNVPFYLHTMGLRPRKVWYTLRMLPLFLFHVLQIYPHGIGYSKSMKKLYDVIEQNVPELANIEFDI